ncbi:hypothetical protein NLM33_43760 [Bradyrhizobium sp. CCGUVB1N3]|uniref:hypothetical protein n=1 Tax=Bradyrhizobium sp. CCGUVB1N3 TaxID=2949629 RepID=UPI0020B24300|nr:hypothetical protein [Bradyrhizobium sp. CCGUVB1N3]MCP3477078.1 hypothetical protein [Bradyrhizobium sp. CCGUVB1N3]
MIGRVTAGLLASGLVVLCVVGLPPWPPFNHLLGNLGDLSDDLAFAMAQPALLRQGAQWGPEVVFTYGPLGLLASFPIYPEHVKPLLAFHAAFAGVTAALLIAVVWRSFDRAWSRALGLLLALANAYVWAIGWTEALWIAPALCVGVISLSGERPSRWLTVLLYAATALLGAAALVKFSLTAIYVGVFGLIGLRDVRQRKVPALSLFFAASVLGCWLLAGQQIGNLAVWLQASADLSGGYSDAMSKGFWQPYGPATVAVTYLAAAGLVAVGLLSRGPLFDRLLLTVLAAGVSLVNLKHTFGGNQIEQSVIMVALAATLIGFVGSAWSRAAAALSIGACCLVLSWTNFQPQHLALGLGWMRDHAASMVAALSGNYDYAATGGERLRAQIRHLADLPEGLTGTADIYPRKTGVVLAEPGLTYDPRPAYLSLNAHTEKLSEQNAAFLRSERAPRFILFEMRPEEHVNDRYPSTDDGRSWPEIWSRYRLTSSGRFLVYERRPAPLSFSRRPIRSGRFAFDQVVEIDPGLRTWATIDVRPTLLGRLVGALYKAPQVMLNIVYDDGLPVSYQIVPALGRAGFLLSPSITTTEEFAGISGRRVKTIRMSVEGGQSWFYERDFGLELSELQIPDESKTQAQAGPDH